ncbi:MAG: formyltransferase family protein [Gordonia sp. (in: high G+C Gram-positive bacteria)]|uniref:formyltransferase family protein n=1 Tax=Gordonia sp. (in: high G+C Gram-positive bacteria) TaxID=84139 RepID=UPI0039E3A37F
MIFIGSEALLIRALRSAIGSELTVDLVCVPDGAALPTLEALGVPAMVTQNPNADADEILAECTDGIGWSINNRWILRRPLLDSPVRFYNIHNGPLPAYRGLPESAIIDAILDGAPRYGATLHEVDAGIDTGRVIDVEEFPIGDADGFAEVMMSGLRACHTLFERNAVRIAAGMAEPSPAAHTARRRNERDGTPSGYHGHYDAASLAARSDEPGFGRATAFGVFAPHYPELAGALT